MPGPGNPQSLNRFAYVNNNPLRYTDPSGHWIETAWDIANIAWGIYEVSRDPSWLNIAALAVDVAATVLPGVPAGAGLLVRAGKVARAATEGGASALLVFPPAPFTLGQNTAMAIEHFKRIADASDLPLIAFQYPLATGQGYPNETLLRMLEEVRDELHLDRLHAAAIERGARARHMRP